MFILIKLEKWDYVELLISRDSGVEIVPNKNNLRYCSWAPFLEEKFLFKTGHYDTSLKAPDVSDILCKWKFLLNLVRTKKNTGIPFPRTVHRLHRFETTVLFFGFTANQVKLFFSSSQNLFPFYLYCCLPSFRPTGSWRSAKPPANKSLRTFHKAKQAIRTMLYKQLFPFRAKKCSNFCRLWHQ